MPFVRHDNGNNVVVIAVALFVFALLFAGTCGLVHRAC
jgi:hypothetical protein